MIKGNISWSRLTLLDQVRPVCVDNDNGCWIWTNKRGEPITGYPQIYIEGKLQRVGRLLLEDRTRRLGQVARHKCDTPPCCNPDHLEWGTYQDNADDREIRGRTYRRLDGPPIPRSNHGENHWSSILTDEIVLSIRNRRANGETMASIARSLGLTYRRVNSVVKRHTWKHI